MINSLLNFAAQAALLLLVIWATLALLGLKWHFFRTIRRGYSNLIKATVVSTLTWLWTPGIQRQGGGYLSQTSSEYREKKEEDEWAELEEEGLP